MVMTDLSWPTLQRKLRWFTAEFLVVLAGVSPLSRVWPYYLDRIKLPPGSFSLPATIRANYPALASDSHFRILLLHQSQAVRPMLVTYANALSRAEALRRAVEARLAR